MVLIFSVQGDLSTSDVIEWILYFKECCFRINNVHELNSLLELYPFLSVPETKKKFTSVWYRNSPNVFLPATIMDNKKTDKDIREYVYSEQHGLFEAVYSALEGYRWLGDWTNSSPGKFKQLLVAESVGLTIPKSAIICTKEQLYEFVKNNGNIILKPIKDISSIEIEGEYYFQYTKYLKNKDIKKLKNTFFPCLIQKRINKNLEIRTFYIDGQFYSMAICSTFDQQTQMDYRRYNDLYPNRVVPYRLPSEIEQNLLTFMTEMNLNCGSIDLILDTSGKYYFLEANPVGQFGMVSIPCNYYLEREIAKFLTRNKIMQ